MHRLYFLILSFLVCIEPLQAYALKTNHYRMAAPIQFGKVDRIPESPFLEKSMLPSQKKVALSGLAAFPLFGLFLPAGFFVLGASSLMGPYITLKNKIENLNKVVKQITPQKTMTLYPYLGNDGIELLTLFLAGKQKYVDNQGKVKSVRILQENGKRNEGVNVLVMRDLIHEFIQKFYDGDKKLKLKDQKKKKVKLLRARGSVFEEDLRDFFASLGLVTWSQQTLQETKLIWPELNVSQREIKLYYVLNKEKIIDSEGGLRSRASSSRVQKALSKYGIKDQGLQRLILHDIGFIHSFDLDEIEKKLPEFLASNVLKEPYESRIESVCPRIRSNIGGALDAIPKSEEDLKERLDLAILKALVPEKDIQQYKKKHKVKLGNNIADQLTIYKLAYIESVNIKEYNYLSLEEDIKTTQAFIMTCFHRENIHNDLYRIVSLKDEDLAINTLNYIKGMGFVTMGGLQLEVFTLNTILQYKLAELNTLMVEAQAQQSAEAVAGAESGGSGSAASSPEINQLQKEIEFLTQAIELLNYISSGVLLGIGIITLIVNTYEIIGRINELKQLHNSRKVSELLIDHLKNTTKNPLLLGKAAHSNEVIRFNAVTDNYLNKLKKKSLLNGLSLNVIWLMFGSIATFNGAMGLLLVFGVSIFVLLSSLGSFGMSAFFMVAALPIILLAFRELRLKKELGTAIETVESFQRALAEKQPHLERKRQLFLQIFLDHVKDCMKLAVCGTEIKSNQSKIKETTNPYKIETRLVKLYGARRKAIKQWKKLNKDNKTSELFGNLIEEELSRQEIQLPLDRLKNLRPSTFRSGIDFILEAFHPGMSETPSAKLLEEHSLPEHYELYSYERDVHLSHLFNSTYQIYRNIKSNVLEYRYLQHKQNLQYRYFGTSITNSEVKLLLSRYKKRQSENRFTYRFDHFGGTIDSLNAIHKPVPKGRVVAWDDQFLPQLSRLMGFDDGLKDKVKQLRKIEDKEMKVEIPNHSRVELLLRYFLPMKWLGMTG